MNKKMFSFFAFFLLLNTPSFALQEDFLVEYINKETVEKPITNLEYNYKNTKKIPIYFHIKEPLSTRDKNIYEGMKLEFVSDRNIYDKGELILKKGDIVEGKLKFIIKSGMNGIPYSLTVGDFKIKGISENALVDEYYKQGWDRGYVVYPLKWALTFLPPTGTLTNFIKGGHSKISTRDEIVINYFPEWNK